MRRVFVSLLAAALLAVQIAPAGAQTSIATRRIGVGPTPTMPDGSSVRLQGLLTSGGTEFLVLDPEGDAIRRLLATGDIPSAFTRRDVPESISQTWQFGAGLTALAASSFTSATFSSTIGVTNLATLTGGYAAGASSSITGNLTLSGNARRLLGDFSTATVANRTSVQSSTTNGATHLQALPNGTSTTSSFVASAAATPTNAAFAQLLATSTEASLRADRYGSGSYLPLTFQVGGAERFRFATDGTGVVQPTTALRTDHYASGTTGWALTGAGDFDTRRIVAGEIQTKSYIADIEQALNGGQLISKSNAFVAQAFTCPAPSGTGTLWVRDYPSAADMRVFASGDWVVLRIHARADSDADGNLEMSVADCVGVVTSYGDQVNGLQTWTFTRAAAPNGGSASTGAVVPVETIALDFGTANSGLLETTVLDGAEGINSPYLQVFTWATSPIVSNRTVRTRLGKLTGLTGTANEFGLLAGAYAATDGRYLRASNSAFELHGVDLTIWDGSTQAFLMRRNSGAPYFSIGSPAPTTFGSGVGFWAGDDGGTYKLRIGNPAAHRLTFDGSTLTIVGDGSGVTSINGGNIQTDTITATQIAANAITASELSAGSVTAGKLSVSTLSAITADLGTITAGTLNAVTINSPTIQSPGKWSLTDASGLLFADASSFTDYGRMIRWGSGAYIAGQSGPMQLRSAPAVGGSYGAIQLMGSPSVGGQVTLTSSTGGTTSDAYFLANASGGSTLYAGSIIPATLTGVLDGTQVLGLPVARYDNINLALDPNASPAFVIVNKGGGGADQFSALGYIAGVSKTVTIGCGTLIFTGGVLTGGTCP
ncbi:hypothetical protein [Luteitalea sp.]